MANNPEQLFGDYAASYNRSVTRTPSEGLADVAEHILYAAGCTDNKCLYYNKSSISAAVTKSDMIGVCLGTGNPYLERMSRMKQCLKHPQNVNYGLRILIQEDTFRVAALLNTLFYNCEKM